MLKFPRRAALRELLIQPSSARSPQLARLRQKLQGCATFGQSKEGEAKSLSKGTPKMRREALESDVFLAFEYFAKYCPNNLSISVSRWEKTCLSLQNE